MANPLRNKVGHCIEDNLQDNLAVLPLVNAVSLNAIQREDIAPQNPEEIYRTVPDPLAPPARSLHHGSFQNPPLPPGGPGQAAT